MLISNPASYSDRQNTNLRLDEDVKEALARYVEDNNTTMSDVVNELLKTLLVTEGYIEN